MPQYILKRRLRHLYLGCPNTSLRAYPFVKPVRLPNLVQSSASFQSISTFIFRSFNKYSLHEKPRAFYSTFAFSLFYSSCTCFPHTPIPKARYFVCKFRLPSVSPVKDRLACCWKIFLSNVLASVFSASSLPGLAANPVGRKK